MTSKGENRARSLTVLLLRPDAEAPHGAIRNDCPLRHLELTLAGGRVAHLFIKRNVAKPPPWIEFFADHVDPSQFGHVLSSSAALLVEAGPHWFALTFGQGRYLLGPDAVEEGFGLRVALNAIGDSNLRSVDKETFDAIAGQARVQASKDAPAAEFSLDVYRDLVRAISGTPEDSEIGGRVTGRDALAISARVSLNDLEAFLLRLTEVYESKAYQRRFPWIDQIRPIRDETLIDRLNETLFADIRGGDFGRTWLAPPEILDWQMVRYFSYGLSARFPELMDIHWRTFLETTRGDGLDLDTLRSRYVYCLGDDRQLLAKWPVFRCIYAEVDTEDGAYILTAGRWFAADKDFVKEIDEFFKTIPRCDDLLPPYDDESEAHYNQRIAAESNGHYALMDRRIIPYGGGKSGVEFCDLLSKKADVIHVKRYSGSREMSHLFAQAFVSGELLLLDGRFRAKVIEKLPVSHKPLLEGDVKNADYRIVLGLVSRSSGSLSLPFFSKVSLRHAVQRLGGYGFRVCLSKIGVESTRRVLKKYRSRKV